MRLELPVLVTEPLGVTLLGLAAAKGTADPACESVGRKYLDVLRAGRGDEAVLDVIENWPAGLHGLEGVFDGEIFEGDD